MTTKDILSLSGSILVLVAYFLGLSLLAFRWNSILAGGLIGFGLVSWGFVLICLLHRLKHQMSA